MREIPFSCNHIALEYSHSEGIQLRKEEVSKLMLCRVVHAGGVCVSGGILC